EAEEVKSEHDFWGDAFYEADLQLVVAKRWLKGGSWTTEVTDPKAVDAVPKGVTNWLAVQDIRAAVHLTNSLQSIRPPHGGPSPLSIQVVHSDKVNLVRRNRCAIALGLGFTRLTHELQDLFNKQL